MELTDLLLPKLFTGIHAGDCRLHEFFISFNMILCIILSVTSVLPIIQENLPNSGLLQGGDSICSIKVTYGHFLVDFGGWHRNPEIIFNVWDNFSSY